MLRTNKDEIFKFSMYGNPNEKMEKIHANFIPIKYNRFITVCADNEYEFWPEVLEMVVSTLLKLNIHVVVVSTSSTEMNCSLNIKNISIRHAAYILENSLFHFCGQDWSLSLAQNNSIERLAYLSPEEQKENFPENMAKTIFKSLGINQDISVKTVLAGPSYGVDVLEMIPDFEINYPPNVKNGTQIGIRCDLVENWPFVLKCLQMGIRPTVLTKKLPTIPLAGFLGGIQSINLYADETTNPKDIKEINALGINLKILLREGASPETKQNLFDTEDVINVKNWGRNNIDKLEHLRYDTKIRSKRLLVGKEGTFLSVYHWRQNLSTTNKKGHLLLDGPKDEEFLCESDLFYYYH